MADVGENVPESDQEFSEQNSLSQSTEFEADSAMEMPVEESSEPLEEDAKPIQEPPKPVEKKKHASAKNETPKKKNSKKQTANKTKDNKSGKKDSKDAKSADGKKNPEKKGFFQKVKGWIKH